MIDRRWVPEDLAEVNGCALSNILGHRERNGRARARCPGTSRSVNRWRVAMSSNITDAMIERRRIPQDIGAHVDPTSPTRGAKLPTDDPIREHLPHDLSCFAFSPNAPESSVITLDHGSRARGRSRSPRHSSRDSDPRQRGEAMTVLLLDRV